MWKQYCTDALKFVTVAVKVPSAAATIGVVVPIVCAILTFPHGACLDGRWTSLRVGVPLTPNGGWMIACADA